MAMVTARTEPSYQVVAFTAASMGFGGQWGGGLGMTPLDISARSRLADVVAKAEALPFGGTDCALPMVHALANGWEVDTFVVLTDNETWAGTIHPVQALRAYREQSGIPAKLIVVGLTATGSASPTPRTRGHARRRRLRRLGPRGHGRLCEGLSAMRRQAGAGQAEG